MPLARLRKSMSKKKSKKKTKVKYIDDGRTIADMSGTSRTNVFLGGTSGGLKGRGSRRAPLKDQAKTFFGAMKMMFFPMLITMGILTIAFIILYIMMVSSSILTA